MKVYTSGKKSIKWQFCICVSVALAVLSASKLSSRGNNGHRTKIMMPRPRRAAHVIQLGRILTALWVQSENREKQLSNDAHAFANQ